MPHYPIWVKRHKSFLVTTDSRHSLPLYPHLAREITPSAVNQLWVADITYLRLRREFVYLAVLLDAYSRRVIGWALGCTWEAELTLAALRLALRQRQPAPGLVQHSDRGVQYASAAYTDLLQQYPHHHQHESQGKPRRQRPGREFHENVQIGGSLPHRISRLGRCLRVDW